MEETKKTSFGMKLFKVLLAILVPLLFIVLLAALFLKLSGVDPINEAKQLIFPESSTSQQSDSSGTEETAQLKQDLSNAQTQNEQLNKDNKKLTTQINDLKDQFEQLKNDAETSSDQMKSQSETATQAMYAQTYRSMDPAKAGAILSKLSVKQAAKYINYLDDKTKAAILETMDPEKAAQLTELLEAKQSNTNTTESAGTSASTATTPAP
ncbi:magnesium transporter MgtE N-terminal domain-containing protein [Sporolactobacillus terrae]|uniref:Magnesium transporter MgtE intracellular domain-containing protein n=1 Tax=Sporolactobacillus terrae TaxID=269673 RepID=A0ABX5Q6T6_9BACL|nr:hypothetical protein [Sporolactobacillus terrae]QAA22343.1 hypothetical protein C0674_06745 [Sporolactobacillus terrae]QAA25319.1 hypothetical protein C0679_06730 [Sporolactobacillus terrae]UAK17129.1 hypothetical protein K7399_04075 [Sporolactobacillus terrae]